MDVTFERALELKSQAFSAYYAYKADARAALNVGDREEAAALLDIANQAYDYGIECSRAAERLRYPPLVLEGWA